jgi:cob(I)alamin adenosyltransferase
MNVYTRLGDKGKSSIDNNRNVMDKSSLVFEVLGTLDELTSTLGFLHLSKIADIKKITINIQGDLITLGSIITGKPFTPELRNACEKKILNFEKLIDIYTARLPLLKSFILPGGCIESSYLHLSRVVCRRLERVFVKYVKESRKKDLEPIGKYFNRLSDLLFVLARYSNKKRNYGDTVWKALK